MLDRNNTANTLRISPGNGSITASPQGDPWTCAAAFSRLEPSLTPEIVRKVTQTDQHENLLVRGQADWQDVVYAVGGPMYYPEEVFGLKRDGTVATLLTFQRNGRGPLNRGDADLLARCREVESLEYHPANYDEGYQSSDGWLVGRQKGAGGFLFRRHTAKTRFWEVPDIRQAVCINEMAGILHSDHTVEIIFDPHFPSYDVEKQVESAVAGWSDIVGLSCNPSGVAGVCKDGTVLVAGASPTPPGRHLLPGAGSFPCAPIPPAGNTRWACAGTAPWSASTPPAT